MLGQLIQSLVRFDPAARDPAEAMRIIKLMEAYDSSLEKEWDDEPGFGQASMQGRESIDSEGSGRAE